MKPLRFAALAIAIAVASTVAGAQTSTPQVQGSPPGATPPTMGSMGSMPMHHPMGGMMAHQSGQQAMVPTESGQAAFGAIQQIVAMLQAEPSTDWSKVDVDALRQHLIDMDEVTLRAATRKEPIENGLRVSVTGNGRTLEAIQRMVPEHAHDIDGINGWTVRTTPIQDGVDLTVTASGPADVQKIRALGFMGIMVLGGHHQMHHLAMAKGEMMHAQ